VGVGLEGWGAVTKTSSLRVASTLACLAAKEGVLLGLLIATVVLFPRSVYGVGALAVVWQRALPRDTAQFSAQLLEEEY
jgi:hypothetical protein